MPKKSQLPIASRTYVSKRHGKRRAWQQWAREFELEALLDQKAGKHAAQAARRRMGVQSNGVKITYNEDLTRKATPIIMREPVRLHSAPRRSKYMPGCGSR